MSRRYFRVGPRIWLEPWSETARYLAFYLLTCQHRTTEGIYRLPIAYALADLGWSEQRLREGLAELLANGFAEYDFDAQICWLPKALAWQAPENPNQVTAAVAKIAELPETPLLPRFLTVAETLSQRLAEGLRERFPNGFTPLTPSPTQEQPPLTPPQAGGNNDNEHPVVSEVAPDVPAGGRRRTFDKEWQTFCRWADTHFPGSPHTGVASVVTWVRDRGGVPTPQACREFVAANENFAHALEVAA